MSICYSAIHCIKKPFFRTLLYIICEKCGNDLISNFPFWPRESVVPLFFSFFLSDQLFIFGLPNVVPSTVFCLFGVA